MDHLASSLISASPCMGSGHLTQIQKKRCRQFLLDKPAQAFWKFHPKSIEQLDGNMQEEEG